MTYATTSLRCAAAILLCASAPAAEAARACISNSAQLALVLAAAQGNGEDDRIYLETGNYLLGGELQYVAPASETYNLTISGGYAAGSDCFVRSTAASSVLDGQSSVRPLYISAHGRVNISNLTFQNGKPTQSAGGALSLSGPFLDVESNVFVNNGSSPGNSVGAVYMASQVIVLTSNVFLANSGTAAGAVYLVNDWLADVNNNTFIANTLIGGGLGALYVTGSGHYNLSNNILWNNDGADVYDQSGAVDYWHNDIGVKGGLAPLSETGDFSVAPQFEGFLSLRPAPASLLVNGGIDSPLGGIGATDAGGGTRRIGQHVDIGAYESDVL
ncbi:MAG: hypothetical protein ABIQ70_03445, partial [Dokdonella sp.]